MSKITDGARTRSLVLATIVIGGAGGDGGGGRRVHRRRLRGTERGSGG
jgi:hypothetical protein